jgi:hypothetical protein
MCRSAFHSYSLDASSLAADLTYMLDNPISEADKDGAAAFFNSLQDPQTGFYHEPFVWELADSTIDRVLEMSGTYLGFQVCGALEALGRLPAYPFKFYEFALQEGEISRYLEDEFPWDRSPWGAGGWVDSVATMLQMNIALGMEEYRAPLAEMLSWLLTHQSPETGLWGKPDSAQGLTGLVNGGYHLLRGIFFRRGLEVPWPEKVVDSCLRVYRECEYFRAGRGDGCHDLDLFDLLIQTTTQAETYRRQEITDICTERLKEILTFQNDDGGFSFYPHRAKDVHNYYRVSPGLKESDIQGTVFTMQVLRRLAEYLNFPFAIKRSKTHGYF